jgi:hypothetical protein
MRENIAAHGMEKAALFAQPAPLWRSALFHSPIRRNVVLDSMKIGWTS